MLDPSGKTYLNLEPARPGGAARDAELYEAVRQAVTGHYELLGELGRGRGRAGSIVYLVRDLATAQLVALRLDRTPGGGENEFELTVVEELDESIPAAGAQCPYCHRVLDGWGAFCPGCGRDITGADDPATSSYTPTQLLEAVRAAAEGTYEVLGEMRRASGGGTAYFARDLATGAIVALRLQRDDSVPGDPQFSLGRTQVLKPLIESMGVDYASPTMLAPPAERAAATPPATPPATPRAPASVSASAAEDRPAPHPAAPPAAAPRASAAAPAAPTPPAPRNAVPLPADRTIVGMDPMPRPSGGDADDAGGVPAEPLPPQDGGRRRAPLLWLGLGAVALAGAVAVAMLGAGEEGRIDDAPVDTADSVVAGAPDTGAPTGRDTARPPAVIPGADSTVLVIGGTLPQGARIRVGARTMSGRRMRLAEGEYTLVAEAPGYQRATTTMRVRGDTARWSPRLERAVVVRDTTTRPQPPTPPPAEGPTCARAVGAQDFARARELCGRDANAGVALAQRHYGLLLLRGLGGPVDQAGAFTWMQRAADANDVEAQYGLAQLYRTRRHRDDRRAFEYFRRAAQQGHLESQLQTGRALERGIGTREDHVAAFGWYERAANGGYPAAQTALGVFYKKGMGTRRDDAKAVEWLTRGAQGGNADAHFHLGEMHEEGRGGLQRSRTAAIDWYTRGAALGSEEARRALARLR